MSLLIYLALAVKVSSAMHWWEQQIFPCNTSRSLMLWPVVCDSARHTVEADALVVGFFSDVLLVEVVAHP